MIEAAIFGGSFNPPHIGHTCGIVYALQHVQHLIVVPTWKHRFKDYEVSFEDRYLMCQLAFGWLPNVEISSIEKDSASQGKTLETIKLLQDKYPSCRLRLLIGSDILKETHQWYKFDEIKKIAPPLVLDRETLAPNISSTLVRSSEEKRAKLLHPSVYKFIQEKNLYPKS